MKNICAICGVNLDMTGRSHRCIPKVEVVHEVSAPLPHTVHENSEFGKGKRSASNGKRSGAESSGPTNSRNETDNRSAARKADKSPSRTAAPEDARLRGQREAKSPELQAAVTISKKRAPRGTFDRTAYQRELMRRRRAEPKAEK